MNVYIRWHSLGSLSLARKTYKIALMAIWYFKQNYLLYCFVLYSHRRNLLSSRSHTHTHTNSQTSINWKIFCFFFFLLPTFNLDKIAFNVRLAGNLILRLTEVACHTIQDHYICLIFHFHIVMCGSISLSIYIYIFTFVIYAGTHAQHSLTNFKTSFQAIAIIIIQ